jgi:hypothetical protein
MFKFLSMLDTYEDRKVARYEQGGLFISTALVNDSDDPYETAVAHPAYNDGEIVIVETYGDLDSAKAGHEKWVSIMTRPELPAKLVDTSTALIAKLCRATGNDLIFENEED